MTVLFTLTSAGLDTGPFNLYSNLDGFVTPFEVGVLKATLVGGFSTANVPDYTTSVRIKSTGSCPNWVDIILENTTTSTTTGIPTTSSSTSTTSTTIANTLCGTAVAYSGGQSYPTIENILLGSDTGPVVLQFNALSVPDRYIVKWNSSIVIDTGYKGSLIYDFGQSNRNLFKSSLLGLVDPVTLNIYPDFGTYTDDGYPRITSPASSIDSFIKTLAAPDTASVEIYAPMSGTGWNFTLNCPNGGPTTTSTTTGIPTTSTTSTTITPASTTTSTTVCPCGFYDLTVEASDIINSTGNTNPALNGAVIVTYVNCFGDVEDTSVGAAAFYPDICCSLNTSVPQVTYWKDNIEYTADSFVTSTGETCCS